VLSEGEKKTIRASAGCTEKQLNFANQNDISRQFEKNNKLRRVESVYNYQ